MTATTRREADVLPDMGELAVPAHRHPVSVGAVIRAGLYNPKVRDRYLGKVHQAGPEDCWYWCGALHARKGHARFWVGTYLDTHGARRDVAVIGHRFGWALVHGYAALLDTPVLAHDCDEPSCQNPDHVRAATMDSNREDFQRRRWLPRSPLRDTRGPAGRARAIRAAILDGTDIEAAKAAGIRVVDDAQLLLW